MGSIRLTRPTLEVIKVLMASTSDDPAWGLKICMEADLGSGTVYPILDRLLDHGWVTSRNESEPHPSRPPRRYYELTAVGQANAAAALEGRRSRRTGWRPARSLPGSAT
ncbi:helix-turn-helix transcriptional regulator [Streptomyces sp. BH105]|uniref:helix-turn-helix transcriptional regulator n=1 Tax=Streptomyces sp. BH105 TaxID=3410408 RepID=UPI003CEDC4C2